MTKPAEAAFTEQVLDEWRDWRAYLQAQQWLLDARRRDDTPDDPFEQRPAAVQEADAQATLNRLPPARRSLFEQVKERRREEVAQELDAERRLHGQRGAPDPDEIDVHTLQILTDECEGRGTDDGRGMVPREDETYWGLDVADLLDTPAAGAYAIKGSVTPRQKAVLISGMVGLVLVLCVAGWLVLGMLGGDDRVAGADALLVNGEPSAPLTLYAVQVGPDAPPLPLTPVPAPTPFPPDGATAAARPDSVYPPLLCLDAGTLDAAAAITLIGAAHQPARHYTLRPPGDTANADLLVRPCDGRGEPRGGILQQVTPPTDHQVGDTVTLTRPDGRAVAVTVPAITLVGPGHDLTLPATGARVLVTVQADQAVDWPTLNPALTLHTGAQVLPAETQALETGGVQFRFLIDAPPTALDTAFVLQSGETVVRWRTTLDPPPLTVLRSGLRVSDVQAQPGEQDGGLVPLSISAMLENTLDVPLTLTPTDVTLTQDDRPLPLPDLAALRDPLAAGEQRALELLLEVTPDSEPLTLTIGAQRYTLVVTLPDAAEDADRAE
jgi:hypothetical protein